MSKNTYRVISPAKFTNFLRKFSSIESTLLVEIENENLKAKTHTPDRSVVKSSSISLEEVLEFVDGNENINVVFGLYNIEKFASSFKHFGSDNFDLIIEYEKLDKTINVGTQLTLKNQKLNIRFECASYRIFTHISDDMMEKISGDLSEGISFDLDKNTQAQISSLSGIDNDHKLLTFKTEDKFIRAMGKSFDLELVESHEKLESTTTTIYKQHFNVLDREDSNAVISDDKIVFRSVETNTIMVVGKTEE
jgi:hypothetical protein